MFSLGNAYGLDQQNTPTPDMSNVGQDQGGQSSDPVGSAVGNFMSGVANSPIGQGIGNIFSGIDNFLSPQKAINQNAPDTFSLIGDALSLPQRGLFSLASPIVQGITGNRNPAPNYFDFSQNPGALMDKQVTGGNNFLGDLGFGLLDPMMLLGGPEGDVAKALLDSGKTVGLTDKAVSMANDLAKTRYGMELPDLALQKGGDQIIQGLRNEVANANPDLTKNLGVTFAGKTIVPQEKLDALGNNIKGMAQGIGNSQPMQKFLNTDFGSSLQDALGSLGQKAQALFNTANTPYGNLSKQEMNLLAPIKNAGFVAKSKAINLVKDLFSGFDKNAQDSFYNIAKLGLPTVNGVMNRTELIGKTLDELKQLAPDVSPNVLQAYHKYINNVLPELSQIAKDEFGLSSEREAENYIHDMMTNKMTKRDIYGSAPMQSKIINKSGSTKQKVVSAGLNAEEARRAGFETNPAVLVGRLAHERYMAQERNGAVRDLLNSSSAHKVSVKDLTAPAEENIPAVYEWLASKGFKPTVDGKWINGNGKAPSMGDAIQFWKDQKAANGETVHGIYQPQGNLGFYRDVSDNSIKVSKNMPTYLTSKALASRLNELRVGDAFKVGPIQQLLKATSNGLLKLDFMSPQFALVHGLWHLAPNAFLEGGTKLFSKDVFSQALNDMKEGSPLYKKLSEMGALPHVFDHSNATFNDVLKEAAAGDLTRENYLKMIWSKVNPTSSKYIPNDLLSHEDSLLRLMSVRNNLNKGMTLSESAQRANKFMVDYQNLTSSEKASLRLFMPFYAWTKGNLGAQAAAWMEHPWRQILPTKVMDVLNQEFSGHNMASNASGHQADVNIGQNPEGRDTYMKVPLGSRDISQFVNNPWSAVTNRAGQVEKAAEILRSGTDFGYPVVDPNSPTPQWLQKATGAANNFIPGDLPNTLSAITAPFGVPSSTFNLPTLERKGLGIGLASSQYPSAASEPSEAEKLGSLTGVSFSSPSNNTGGQNYYQQKYLKSMRKKGL